METLKKFSGSNSSGEKKMEGWAISDLQFRVLAKILSKRTKREKGIFFFNNEEFIVVEIKIEENDKMPNSPEIYFTSGEPKKFSQEPKLQESLQNKSPEKEGNIPWYNQTDRF